MTAPLLTYALSTTPNPLQAGATGIITLMATNNTPNPVSLAGLLVKIPTGTNSNDLTALPGQINISLPLGWQEDSPNIQPDSYTFVLIPGAPGTTAQLPAGSSLVFVLDQIAVNTVEGTSLVTITEGSAGNPELTVPVPVFPSGWGSVSFSVLPTVLAAPGPVVLNWNGPVDAVYQIEYIDPVSDQLVTIPSVGALPLANTGTYPGQGQPALYLNATTTFTLIATKQMSGFVLKNESQVTASVASSPEITSYTGQLSVTPAGPELLLNWTTKNAVAVEGSWTSGQLSISPTAPVTINHIQSNSFQITAVGDNGILSSPRMLNLGWDKLGVVNVGLAPGIMAVSPDSTQALVANSNADTISLISLDNLSAPVQNITVGNMVSYVAYTPDGSYAFALTSNSTTLWVIDMNNPAAPAQTIQVGDGPMEVAVTPNGQYALVSNFGSNSVSVIDLNNLSAPVQTISVCSSPLFLAISPDGNSACALSNMGNTLSLINLNNLGAPAQNIVLGNLSATFARSFTITPDSRYVIATNPVSNTLSVIDLNNPTAPAQSIPVGNQPTAVAATDALVFVTNVGNNTVSVLDLNNLAAPAKVIPVGSAPYSMALTPFSNYVFTANVSAGTVSLIDAQNLNAQVETIAIGSTGLSLAASPNGCYVLVSDLHDNTVTVLGLTLS